MSRFVVLYNFNKYYNRIIKYLGGFEAYLALITPGENTPAPFRGLVRQNVNFFYENGVYAQHVINIDKKDPQFAKVEHPDYLVAEESWTEGEGEQATTVVKVTRWYILSVERVRGNQFRLTLRRDLLADYYESILVAPTFIERGNLNATDPLIFNKEGFTFNQIKKHELLLNFNKLSGKGKGWIVGYLNRSSSQEQDINDIEGKIDTVESAIDWENLPADLQTIITDGYYYTNNDRYFNFDVYNIAKYPGQGTTIGARMKTTVEFYLTSVLWQITQTVSEEGYTSSGAGAFKNGSSFWESGISAFFNRKWRANQDKIDDIFTYCKNKYDNEYGNRAHRYAKYYAERYNGLVYRKDGKFYKLNFTNPTINWIELEFKMSELTGLSSAGGVVFNALLNASNESDSYVYPFSSCPANAKVANCSLRETRYTAVSEEVGYAKIKTNIYKERNVLLDAPYDMFVIPMGSVDIISNNLVSFTTWDNIALAAARGIALNGTALVSDIQVLPYCPFPEILNSDGDIDITNFTFKKDYSYITTNVGGQDVNCGIIIFPVSCRGTFDMEIPSGDAYYSNYDLETISPVEKKIKAETQFARFCSPNFSSFFDINIQKNKGISRLNVDYFYKPYSPYIHVAPYFSGLYGEDYNDPKGLICSGEFSISTAASKWEEYQIQNKNYELIFNRQIENLDVNNAISMEQLKITSGLGIASSALQGMGAGAVAGNMIAGPYGAAVGAVVGGVASGITSMIGREYDINFLARQQREARSYSVDMYTYQLGNIKALPNSLTRVSSLTENNKIFPFIEFYDSTEEEKEALRDKLLYNGMTVMRIGKVEDYIQGDYKYVQGRLIRLVGIDEDSEVVSEIANELKEGAYFYGSDSE